MPKIKYVVYVDDNFHYMDESERYCAGEFNTAQEAIMKCQMIVDGSLDSSAKITNNAEDLLMSYQMYGEDPFIVGPSRIVFSAWDYATKRSKEIYPISKNKE